MSNLAIDTFLDQLVEAVAERVAKKLGGAVNPALPARYTTNKAGPHIPGKTRRWMREHIKSMPGARRVGRDWEISAADYEAWATAEDARRCESAIRPRRPARGAVVSAPATSKEAAALRAIEAAGFRQVK